MMKSFIHYIIEEVKKAKKQLTGHLQHVADYLFYGEKETANTKGLDVDPQRAIRHVEAVHHRFNKGSQRTSCVL